MGFWKKLGSGLKRVAPVAAALTPTPFDDIAVAAVTRMSSADKADQAAILQAMLSAGIRKVYPSISGEALAVAVDAALAAALEPRQ